MIFGLYHYGQNLGFRLDEIPLIIGINWILITLSSASYVSALPFRLVWFLRVALASLIMTLFDALIEPVASQMDFWYWAEGAAPLRNYVAWFFFSLVFHLSVHFAKLNSKNKAALWLFLF